MYKVVRYAAFVSAFFFVSCTNQKSRNHLFQAEEAIVTSFIDNVAEYVNDVVIYPISDTVIFSNVLKMVSDEFDNHYILDSRGTIISLSPDGTQGPLKLYRGRASNEYISAMDICYCDGKISILEDGRIKVFEVSDTRNNYQIDLREIRDPVDAISAVPGDKYYVFSAFSTSAKKDRKGHDNTLRFINRDAKVLSEFIPREDCTFSMNNISQSRNNSYYLRPQSSESIFYQLNKDGVTPAFRVDFGDKAMPARYYYNVANEDIGAYMMSDYYKLPMDLHETKDYVYCRFCGSQASECSLVYSRRTKKCIAWKNTNQDGEFRVVGSDDNYFIIIPSNTEAQYGPFGQIIQPLLKEKCSDAQRAIVKIAFCF